MKAKIKESSPDDGCDGRNKMVERCIISRLHNDASLLEKEAIRLHKAENIHQMHKFMETAKSLRAAANWFDGVATT